VGRRVALELVVKAQVALPIQEHFRGNCLVHVDLNTASQPE
jgi:hypothetical protein